MAQNFSVGSNLKQTLNVGLSKNMCFLDIHHTNSFEDSLLIRSLRKCAKVSQRKNIPKKEILPQKGLRL